MRLAVIILSAALIFGTSALPLHAAEFGTREEALAMVRRVQEKFKKDGPEATFRAINNKAPGLADRDLYPFVTEVATVCVLPTASRQRSRARFSSISRIKTANS